MTVSPALAIKLKDAAAQVQHATTTRDKWVYHRDHAILEAIRKGASLREVAALVGLTHAGVKRIVDRNKEQT